MNRWHSRCTVQKTHLLLLYGGMILDFQANGLRVIERLLISVVPKVSERGFRLLKSNRLRKDQELVRLAYLHRRHQALGYLHLPPETQVDRSKTFPLRSVLSGTPRTGMWHLAIISLHRVFLSERPFLSPRSTQ